MATTTRRFDKDPDSTVDFGFDWSDWLVDDTIASSTWTLQTGLTAGTNSFTDTVTTVWIAGGTAGQQYTAANRITTAGGRTDERTLIITVEQR